MTSRSALLRLALLAAATAPLPGCGDDAGDGGSSAPPTAGQGGAGSGQGGSAAQGGSAGSGGPVAACVPGKLDVCPCAGSKATGTQTCLPDGTFGSCVGCPLGQGGAGGAGGKNPSAGSSGAPGAGAGGLAGSGAGGSPAGSGGAGGSPAGGAGGNKAGAGGEGGSEAGAGGGGSGGASGSNVASKFPCVDAKPVLVQGKETGFETCANGATVRREALVCETSYAPLPDKCPFEIGCQYDSECNEKPFGRCSPGVQVAQCFCSYGCAQDSDCGPGEICKCGDPVGQCIQAGCKTSADCAVGDCTLSSFSCSQSFACQTEQDTCGASTCSGISTCYFGSFWQCGASEGCVAGRPLRSGSLAVRAPLSRGAGAWG